MRLKIIQKIFELAEILGIVIKGSLTGLGAKMKNFSNIKFDDTVLILGAGSHQPYGFPGSKLLKKDFKNLLLTEVYKSLEGQVILNHCQTDKGKICRLLRDLKLVNTIRPINSPLIDSEIVDKLDKFLRKFIGAQAPSIDAFLAQRLKNSEEDQSETIIIGKLLIVYFIKKYEDKSEIGLHDENWIQYITEKFLIKPDLCKLFFSKPPKIYTFNYDNFLEKSLHAHLVNQHDIDEKTAVQMIRNLNITHLYGDINSFQSDDFNYAEAIERIKVIGEERTETAAQVAHNVCMSIYRSKFVYFMGFSFEEQNLKLLFGETTIDNERLFSNVEFYSTHVDLDFDVKEGLVERLPHMHITFPDYKGECTCLDLFDLEEVFRKELVVHQLASVRSNYDPYEWMGS